MGDGSVRWQTASSPLLRPRVREIAVYCRLHFDERLVCRFSGGCLRGSRASGCPKIGSGLAPPDYSSPSNRDLRLKSVSADLGRCSPFAVRRSPFSNLGVSRHSDGALSLTSDHLPPPSEPVWMHDRSANLLRPRNVDSMQSPCCRRDVAEEGAAPIALFTALRSSSAHDGM